MAALILRSRFLPLSVLLQNPKKIAIFQNFATIPLSSSDKYFIHLQQQNGAKIEQTLASIGDKLDSSCIDKVLNKCSANNNSLLGLRFFVWAGSTKSDYRHSAYAYSKACKCLGIRRNPKAVFELFECYTNEGCLVNLKMFKVVLSLCRMAKLADECLWLLRKMPEFNCRPDTTMYNVVIRVVCEKGDLDKADKLMKEMISVDLFPDMITYVVLIKGFCDANRLVDAWGLIKKMKDHGCSPNEVAYSALLHGICRFGSFEMALELLSEMEREGGDCAPNVVTYTSVIQSLYEKKRLVEALAILDRMVACGCAPNRVTISTLIKWFCEEGRVDDVYNVIEKVTNEGSVSTSECYSSIVISLLRIENVQEAEKVFRRMLVSGLKPDRLACGLMTKQLCLDERFVDAFSLFNDIEKIGCLRSVDSDTYSILLVGLCQERRLVEAATMAKVMITEGIKMKAIHANRLAELLNLSRDDDLLMELTKID